MKKIYLIPMLAFFGIALAIAGVYVVNSFTFSTGVDEPFTVQYAVLGDAGDYNVTIHGDCEIPIGTIAWFSSTETSVPTGNMNPEESRMLCVKIDNAGESPIAYTITSSVVTGLGNYEDCAVAFPETTITGDAVGSGTTIDGQEFTVPGYAPAVDGCQVTVDVARV